MWDTSHLGSGELLGIGSPFTETSDSMDARSQRSFLDESTSTTAYGSWGRFGIFILYFT
jgi:hypothetical protein